jgi:hypothetical protein
MYGKKEGLRFLLEIRGSFVREQNASTPDKGNSGGYSKSLVIKKQRQQAQLTYLRATQLSIVRYVSDNNTMIDTY